MIASPAIEWVRIVAERLGDLRDPFSGRGRGDYQLSHDLEDVIAVVDGRPALVDEVDLAEPELRDDLRERIGGLVDDAAFLEALAGYLPGDAESQRRLPTLVDRMMRIAGR